MPDNPDALCPTCRGHRYCPECLGWSDTDIPCGFCRNVGDCPDCDGTGERPDHKLASEAIEGLARIKGQA
jgi:hypothetical protein